ncbi:hypothetical protein [Methanosalsum natronophilum]|uniref:hypothetical protein n=1 Tax=Methanosalsum natronophilum TaxID=768733 RepID=UPI00216991BE|nr:hypothetical protein [Methanosalsum natronophilum]MCS3923965.1 ArsR family metal-binding transcriptional regulator [Methanosalsum natronophilum]
MADKKKSRDIKIVKPCVDEPDRFIAESRLKSSVVMEKLCAVLEKKTKEGTISNLKCSIKLGVAKFEFGGKTVFIYKNGKIDIRRIIDLSDATSIISFLEEMIKTAFIDTSFC